MQENKENIGVKNAVLDKEYAKGFVDRMIKAGGFTEADREKFMDNMQSPEYAKGFVDRMIKAGGLTEDDREKFMSKMYPAPKGVPYANAPERSSMTDQFKVFGQAAQADSENRRKAAEHIDRSRKAHEKEQNPTPRLMTPEEVNEMARQPLSSGKSLDLFGQREKRARQTEDMFRKRDGVQTAEDYRQDIEKNMAALDGLKKRLSEVENDLKGKNKDGTLHNEEMRSILEGNIKRLTEDTRKQQSDYFDKKISELNDLYGAAHLKRGYNLINSTEERRKHLQGIAENMPDEVADDIVRNKSLITDALKNMQRAKRKASLDNDASAWSKFWSGMATGFDGGAGLTLGLSDLSEALHAKAALRRMQEGKGTTTDRILVNSLLDKMDAEELYEPGTAGQIGQGVSDSLEFMLDMAITGGVGGAAIKGVKTAGKAIAKAAGKSIAMQAAETAAKSATKQFAKQIGKDIAASTVGSLASPMMYNEAVRRQNENYLFGRDENGEVTVREAADPESLSESFAQAFLSNNISRIVERGVGPVLEKGVQALAKPLVKITPEWLRFGNNFLSNLGRNVKDWMSVQGFLPESAEEFVEELLTRSLVDQTAREKELGAGKWDDLFSPEWCTVTLGSVAVIQAAMGLPGFSDSTSNATANASRMRKYMKRLPDNIRLDVRRISAMEDDNQRAQALSSLLKRSTDLQRRDIMGYLSSRAAINLGVSFNRAEAQQQEAENYRQTLLTATMDGQNLYIASDRNGNLFAFKPTDNQDPWSIGFPIEGSVEDGTLKIGKPRQIDTGSLDMNSVQEYSMENLLGALAQRQEQQNEAQDSAIGQQEQQAAMPDADAEKVYVAGHEFNYTDPKGNIKTVTRGSRIVPIVTVPSDADPSTVVQVAITKPESATSAPGVMTLSEFQNMLEQGYITAEEQTDTDTASDVQTDEEGNPLPEDEAPIQQEAKPEVESGTEPQEVLPPAQQTPTIENNKDAVAETGTEAAGDTAAESTDNEALNANGSGTGADIETQRVENNEVEPAQPRTNTGEVEPEVSVGTNTEGLMSVVSEVVRNDLIGRSATEEEAADLIARMEANAKAAPEVELTPENWTAQFGENGEVETPIGTVKMGENQYFKLAKRGRDGKLGMVKPTLENPDVIVEDERLPKNGSVSERDTSYVFIKSFTAADGHRYYYFTSVTVKKGNNEVVISNQEKDKKRISELLQQGNVTRISPETSLHPKPQVGKSVSLNETNTPTESDNQDALLGINSSEAPGTDKGTQVAEEKQIRLPENPVQTKYESLLAKTGDENNVIQLANQMVANMQAELNKAQKSKPTGKNEEELLSSILANKEKVSALEKEVQFWKDVAAFPERKRQSEEAARKQQKKIDAQQRAEQARKKNPQRLRLMDRDDALGEPLSLEEYVLRRIATGATKFLWDGTSQGTGGLREHGGGKRFMLQYVDKNTGKVPEVVADDMAQDIMDNYPEFGNVTASDILDSIEGIGVGEQSFSALMTRAEELHNSNDYDARAREEAEEFDREERANEEAAAELARQSVESISDEEYIEISRPRFVGEMFNGDGTPKKNAPAKKTEGNKTSFDVLSEAAEALEDEWNERILDYIYEHYPTQATVSAATNSEQGLREREAMKKDERLQQLRAEAKAAIDKALAATHEAYLREEADGNEVVPFQRVPGADISPLVTERQVKAIARQLKKLGLKGNVRFVDGVDELVREARVRFQSVFHGSPHAFEAFDFSKMGSGEGVQAYGWGGYVTEVEKIGRTYAEALAEKDDKLRENKIINDLVRELLARNSKEEALSYLQSLLNESWSDKKRVKAQIKILETGRFFKEPIRHFYHVEIPTERDGNYLRWEEPVSDGRYLMDELMSALRREMENDVAFWETKGEDAWKENHRDPLDYWLEETGRDGFTFDENSTGQEIYESISRFLGGSDKAASEFLSSLGFVGISYPAQYRSGGRADGKRNYVIFKESDMKITDHIRYEQDSSGEIAGATLPNGDVLLNRGAMRIDTPFHEFAHKLFTYAKGNRSAGRLYEAIRRYAQEAPQAVKDYVSARYPDLKDDAYLDEVFAWALSRQSEGGLEAFLKERGIGVDDTASRTWYERVWDTLKSLWAEVRPKVSRLLGRDFADLSVFDAYDEMGAEETGKALYDLMMGGKRLPGAEKSAEGADARAQMEGAEEAEIERRAKADGTWLKAPNGKPTKLTPKQWVQVRTKAFKDWFGDWELPTKAVNIVSAIADHGFKNFAEAKDWAKKNIVRTLNNEETGNKGEIRISNTSIDKFLSQSTVEKSENKDMHLAVLKVLPSIIRESVDVEQHPDYQKGDDGVRRKENGENKDVTIHRLYGSVSIGDNTYRVKITLKEDARNSKLPKGAYSYEATKIELLAGTLGKPDGDAPNTNNSISVAKLLQGVKKSNSEEEILNSSKVVDENGEPLVVYHGTTNDQETRVWNENTRTYDTDHKPFTVFKRHVGGEKNSGFFFSDNQDNAGGYGYNTYDAYLNLRNPLVIDAKGANYTDVEHDGIRQDTYGWAGYAEKNGFDGVVFRNISDGVGIGAMAETSTDYVAFFPTQIKSATDNVGTFDAGNADIRYQRNWYGGNSGYVGYSMSRRAAEAREGGRFPKTDFKKEYGITDKSLGALTKLGLIDDSEWHHTSKYGNKTTFYSWQDDAYTDAYLRNKKEIDRLSRDYAAAMDKALGGERPPFLSEFDLSRPDMGRIGNDMLTYLQYSVHKKSALTEEEKASFRSRHDQVSQSGLPIEERRAKHREIEAEESALSNAREAEIRNELRDTEEYRAAMKDVEVRTEAYNQAQSILDEIDGVMQRAEPNAIRYRFAGDMFDADGTPKRYRFIGEKGAANLDKAEEANTRLDNLAVARDMEAAGKDAKTVKRATGWERGADKKWRYEEADFEINQDFSDKIEFQKKHNKDSIFKGEYPTIALGSLIKDESLFKAYPELKDLSIQFQDMSREVPGFYTPKTYIFPASITLRDDLLLRVDNPEFYEELNRIYAKDPIFKAQMRAIFSDNKEEIQKYDEAVKKSPFWKEYDDLVKENSGIKSTKFMFQEKSVLAHELQHAIQDIEGFERGGNDKTYRKHLDSLKEKHDAWSMIKEFDSKRDELGQDALPIDVYNAVRDEYLSLGFEFGDDGFASLDAFDKGFNLWARGYDKEGYEDAYNEYQSLTGKFGLGLSNDRYRELSGEVEARNVQNRMDMTPEERRASLASETEDVARKDQIFLKDALGVPAESTDEAFKGNQAETNLSSISQAAKQQVAEELSTKLGVPVAIEGRTTPKGRSGRFSGAKAWFVLPNAKNPNGTVHVNIDNHTDVEDVERSILHEVVGHMGMRRMMGEAGYNNLLDKVYESMDDGERSYFEEYARQEFSRRDGMTDEQYQAELRRVAADEYIAALAEVGADPTTWQKVVALVREALRALGFNLSLSDADIRALLYESRHNLESASYYAEREMFRQRQDEFRAAAELDRRIEEDTEDGIAETNERFNEQLETLTEENANSTILSLGSPNEVLLAAGVANKPMRLYGNKVMSKVRKHGYLLFSLQDLPRAVANPIAVFNNYGRNDNRSILTELRTEHGNILVAVTIGNGVADVDFNVVSSVFGKDKAKIADWINKGYATYIDKKKTLDYISVPAPIAGAQHSQGLSDATKIVQDFENPKVLENVRLRRDLSGTEYDKRLGIVSLTPDGATKRQQMHKIAVAFGKTLLDSDMPIKDLINYLRHTNGGRVTSETDLWSLKTTIPSKVMHGIDRFKKTIGSPLSDTIRNIYKKTHEQQKKLGVPAKKKNGTYYIGMYLMAKHMPERNAWMLADRMLGKAIEDISQRIFNMTGGRGAMNDKDMNELRRAVLTRFGSDYNDALSESSIQEITRQIHGIIEKRNQERFEKEQSRAEKKGITPPVDTMQPLTVEDMGMVAEKAYAALNDRLGKLTDEDRDFSGATDFVERFGMKPEEYVDRFEAIMRENRLESELDKMWDYINQATEFSLRERLESGLLSKEAYNSIMARGWKNYVPLRSWDERNEESADYFEIEYPERIDNNSTVFTNPTIKAEGRHSLADNPLPYIFRDAETAIRKGEENRFFQAVAKLRDDNANFTYIFGNAAFLEGKETSTEKNSHLVPYYNNGVKTNVVFVNPQLAAAVRGDTESAFGKVWRSAALNWIPPVTRFMSAMLTSMNPAFATLNLMRDLGLATLSRFVEAPDPFRGTWDAALFLYEWFRNMPAAIQASAKPGSVHTGNGRNARMIRAWKENGGETGWHTLNDLRRTKDQLYKEITKSGVRKGIENVTATIPVMFQFFTEVSENSVRLAAFSDAKRRGLDDQAAAFYSKEVTTNFNRHSNLSSAVNPLFMFFNAATQGINRILQLMKENPGNFGITAVGMMAAGFVSAITNAAGGDDEDDYLHRSFYVRSNNLVIGKWTIPLAHGFRMFYGIGAAYADYVMGNASEAEMFYNVLGIFGNELIPGPLNLTDLAAYNPVEDRINWISEEGIGGYMRNLVPSSILPVYEIYRNRNFMGGTISREPFPGTESKYTPRVARSKKNVTPWLEALNYKWAGLWGFDPELDSEIAWDDKENRPTRYPAVSASDMEHLISQYAGGTGEFVIDMVNIGTKIARGEEFTRADVPVLKKLYRPTDPENAIMGDYYTIKEYADVLQMKIDEAWKQVQNDPDLSDRGRRKAVDRILNLSLAQAESQLKAFDKYQEMVEELYKMQRKGVSENELKPYRIWLMKEANNIKEGMLLKLEPEQGERYARIMDIKNGDLRGLAAFWKFIEDTYGGKAVNE